jgi:hypothetical protein
MRDIEAIWFGQGAELARRMDALAAHLEEIDPVDGPHFAGAIRDVLNCDHNPLPDQLPELGDPPLRPAVPRTLTLPPPLAEHAARCGQDPGA